MKNVQQPLVSIVTPLYNEAKYLVECIESVLAQTYGNWDYTIVNNRSTDGSDEIARRYAAKDSRIRVKDNRDFLRAFPNHNEAMRQISPDSKYCKVVFADDWIFPECLERMVAVAEENPTVGIVGAYTLEGTQVTCTGLPYPSSRVSGKEICRRQFLERLYVWGSANTLLFRSDLVRRKDPFFNESNIHADTETCFELLRECDFGFVHQVLTYTRVRPESLTAVAADIQTNYASMLYHMQTYGPDCLSPRELEECISRHMSHYYDYLGKSLLMGRDKTFWHFHKTKLKEYGEFSIGRLIWGALSTLAKAALRPKAAIERVRSRGKAPDLTLSSRFAVHQEEIQ